MLARFDRPEVKEEPPAAVLEHARAAASKYAKGSQAVSTGRAYESDWRIFSEWCAKVTRPALPAETSTVALFIAAQTKLGIHKHTAASNDD